MHNSIMIDSILSGLISNTQLNTDTYYNLNCAKKQLKIMNNSSYTNLYVYFKSNGYTVSGTAFDTLYDFYKTHFDGKYTYDEFTSVLENLKDMDMSILSDTDGSIVLLQNVILNSVPVDGVYTYFFINRSLFDSTLNTGDGSVMLVKADNGEVVYCNRDYNGLNLSDKKYIKYERRAGKLTLSYYADSTFCILLQLHVYDKITDRGTNYLAPLSMILFTYSFLFSSCPSSALAAEAFLQPSGASAPPVRSSSR